MAGEVCILKGGPRSRWVYFTAEFEVNRRADPRMAPYERTDEFVTVGAIYQYLPRASVHLGDARARIFQYRPSKAVDNLSTRGA